MILYVEICPLSSGCNGWKQAQHGGNAGRHLREKGGKKRWDPCAYDEIQLRVE